MAAARKKPSNKGRQTKAPVKRGPKRYDTKGKPTKYRPEYVEIARAMCKFGATDWDLCLEFDVVPQTIVNWQLKHPEFADAIKIGKDAFDDRVERAMAHRAVGYTFREEKVFCFQGQIVTHEVDTHVPPDVSAAKNWLANRRKDKWQDTAKHEVTGKDGAPLVLDSGSQIEQARLIAFAMHKALTRKRDPETIESEAVDAT